METRPDAAPDPSPKALQDARARLTAAFDSIATHAARLATTRDQTKAPSAKTGEAGGSAGRAEAEIARLTMLLDDERVANAQLEARLRALRTREDERLAMIEDELAQARARVEELVAEREELRAEVEAVLGELDPILAEAS